MLDDKPYAVILLSGGIDSSVALADARYKGFSPVCLAFDYGQRHIHELQCASIQAEGDLTVIPVQLSGSALTFDNEVPANRTTAQMAEEKPLTYVPGRNTVFLSIAAAKCEEFGIADVFIGANADDYAGYPDCRRPFFDAFEQMVGHWQSGFKIHTPLIDMTKKDVIEYGHTLGVDFLHTSSCYTPNKGKPCQQCDACLLRSKSFLEAGLDDPLSRDTSGRELDGKVDVFHR